MLRRLLSVLLLLTVVGGVAQAIRASGRDGATDLTRSPVPIPVPLLSVRRYPELLVGPAARRAGAGVVTAALRDDAAISESLPISCVMIRVGGVEVYNHNGAVPVIPASTMKTITAAAVLSVVRPDERFTTSVRARRAPRDGVVEGDLWLVGGGDPLLATDDYLLTFDEPPAATSIGQLADRVVAAGVRRVTGSIVGDDRRFDTRRSVATWKRGYLTSGQVGPLSALSVNDSFTEGEGKARRAASDPPLSAARLFTQLLNDRGVTVDGAPLGRPADSDPVPAEQVASIDSPPMDAVIAEMLQTSDNTTAELLLKELGWRLNKTGTTDSGLRAERAALTQAGLPMTGFAANDGSGLDRGDRVTCRLLLDNMAAQPEDGALVQGLSVAGEVGTLRKRLTAARVKGNVRAKTGTLNGVSALVGMMKGPSGARIDFAVVFNGLGSTFDGVKAEDRLVEALAELTVLSADDVGPEAR